jgi:hypothetical protein
VIAAKPIQTALSQWVLMVLLSQERERDFETCSGFPLRLVDANSSSSCSLIELNISFAAPLRLLGLASPRLAASATPAAFCWAADLACCRTSAVTWSLVRKNVFQSAPFLYGD